MVVFFIDVLMLFIGNYWCIKLGGCFFDYVYCVVVLGVNDVGYVMFDDVCFFGGNFGDCIV